MAAIATGGFRMRKMLVSVFGLIAVVMMAACQSTLAEAVSGAAAASEIAQRFVGTWRLVTVDLVDANDRLLPPPKPPELGSTPSVGYLMYDSSGKMAIVIMREGRKPFSEGGPTPTEARMALATYTSYYGDYKINEAERFITHHSIGELRPLPGADHKGFYEFRGNRLILRAPHGQSGEKRRLTWEKVPDAALTPEHRKFVGFWRYVGSERRSADGRSLPIAQHQSGYLIATPSGFAFIQVVLVSRVRDS
jgi:hypothetical protein